MTDDRWKIDTTGIAPERDATAAPTHSATEADPESADEALARATVALIDHAIAPWADSTPIVEATQRSQRR